MDNDARSSHHQYGVALKVVVLAYLLSFISALDPKSSNLTRKEWSLSFKSDASAVFNSEADFQAAIQDLWERSDDNTIMTFCVGTTGLRDSKTSEELGELLSDGGHFDFVSNSNFYVAHTTRSVALSNLITSGSFSAVVPIPPLLKLSTDIVRARASAAAFPAPLSAGTFNLHISVSPGSHVDASALADRWHGFLTDSGIGHEVGGGQASAAGPLSFNTERKGSQVLPFHDLSAHHIRELSDWLANQAEVEYIERRHDVTALNEYASWVTQTDEPDNRLLWDKGLKGQGQVVGLSDTGIDMAHCFFRHSEESNGGEEEGCNPWDSEEGDHRCRKVVQYTTEANEWDDNLYGHGTHVAGSLAGKNVGGSSGSQGMAPESKIAFMDVGNSDGSMSIPVGSGALMGAPYAAGARVYSASWGAAGAVYDAYCRDMDQFLWEHNDVVALVAAGNRGEDGEISLGSPAVAKNVITVGATSNAAASWGDVGNEDGRKNENALAHFSSFGPTKDGRLKPDVCAPGMFIVSAGSNGYYGSASEGGLPSCKAALSMGTSMSTPVVAGNLALARQYFMEGFYPSGTKIEANGFIPSGALLKAISILGTQALEYYLDSNYDVTDLTINYPDIHQGYGRIQMNRSLYFHDNSSISNSTLIDTNSTLIDTNSTLIDTNSTLIDTNSTLIDTNSTLIDTNSTLIDNNSTLIDNNSTLIDTNSTLIDTNSTLIDTNSTLIDNNSTLIDTNSTLIDNNSTLIDTNSTLIDNNSTLIDTNSTLIDTNSTLIDNNSTLIDNNSTLIDNNSTLIDTNSTLIDTNSTLIDTNSTLIDTNSTLIDTNSTLIDNSNSSRSANDTRPGWLYVDGDVHDQPLMLSGGNVTYQFRLAPDSNSLRTDQGNGGRNHTAPFRAVLAWTDQYASAMSRGGLVNDLDLQVTDGSSMFYPDLTAPQPDRLNNVEVVTLPNVDVEKVYTVIVSARHGGVSSPGGQPYALAVRAPLAAAPLVTVSVDFGDSGDESSDDGGGGGDDSDGGADADGADSSKSWIESDIAIGLTIGLSIIVFGAVGGKFLLSECDGGSEKAPLANSEIPPTNHV